MGIKDLINNIIATFIEVKTNKELHSKTLKKILHKLLLNQQINHEHTNFH